jgi:hypothetical protein
MQTPYFRLSIFDFVGTNGTNQIDLLTPLERGRETNLQYLPTNTLEARYQWVQTDERVENTWQQSVHKPIKQ